MRRVEFTVHGIPAPQGSKRVFMVKGRPVLTDASKNLTPWRDSVASAAHEAARGEMFDCPLFVHLHFRMPRPKTVKRVHPTVAPDLDKLERAVFDAMTAGGLIRDDALIVSACVNKRYDDAPGVWVSVREETT